MDDLATLAKTCDSQVTKMFQGYSCFRDKASQATEQRQLVRLSLYDIFVTVILISQKEADTIVLIHDKGMKECQ